MNNTTRNTLLITVATAALVIGAGLASAQDTKENREAPAAAAHDRNVPPGKIEQPPGSLPEKSPAPTAQAPMKEKPAVNAEAPGISTPEAAGSGSATQTSESPKSGQAWGMAKDEAKASAPAALSNEQHAKIRDTLHAEKAERLSNAHFSLTVGEAIPQTVRLNRLPVSIMEFAPQYRDYEYILVGDDILIVDPRTLRIVAVIAS
jgi:hypothetical protein